MNCKKGDRIVLRSTTDPHTTLRRGASGTVIMVDDFGTVHVDWDNGEQLGLVPGEDTWESYPA